MSSKKYSSASANRNATTQSNATQIPYRKIIIATIIILVVVGLYYLIKSIIKKKIVEVVTNAGNIVVDTINELAKPIENPIEKPMKKLDLKIRGVKGDELFSVSALDSTGNIMILLDTTIANVSIVEYSLPYVPFETKTIVFSYSNDLSGRDIVLEELKLNGTDIRPLLIERPDKLASVMNGRLLWGGDYKFDVSNLI